MKLILLSTLLWAVSSSVGALQCLTCRDTECSTTDSVTCSSETMCITTSSLVTIGLNSSEVIFRGCASSSLCPATGNQTFSTNAGFFNALVSARCCDTDYCNSEAPISMSKWRKCISKGQLCAFLQQWEGVEDRCFSRNAVNGSSNTTISVCVSQGIFDSMSEISGLTYFQNIEGFFSEPTCCEGDGCNAVTTAVTPVSTMISSTNMTSTAPASNAEVSTVGALQCLTCRDTECSTTDSVTCSSETMCITTSSLVTIGLNSSEVIFRGCASSSLCPATGNQTFSTNAGFFNALESARCCDTDYCNSEAPISMSKWRKCISKGQLCAFLQQWEGVEDRCFSRNAVNGSSNTTISVCVSQGIFDSMSEISGLTYFQNIEGFFSEPTCCEGDGCNAVTTAVTPVSTMISSSNITSTAPASNAEVSTGINGNVFAVDHQHLGLRIRIAAFQGISNTTLIEAVRKYLQENVLNGTDHNVTSIKED